MRDQRDQRDQYRSQRRAACDLAQALGRSDLCFEYEVCALLGAVPRGAKQWLEGARELVRLLETELAAYLDEMAGGEYPK